MGDPNLPYHNEGFGWAFLNIVLFGLVLPGVIILSIDDGFSKFAKMRGVTGDCWENSRHERVCTVPTEGAKLANCKFWRNFCD